MELERVIRKETTVDAGVAEVWDAWTTPTGVRTFFAPDARLELSIGGPYELLFDQEQEPGKQGSEGCRVLSYLPHQMLSFDWNAPPQFPAIREQRTWVVVQLADKGIIARSTSPKVLAEEAPKAYKDIETVIDTVHKAGISLKVARMVPMGVVKG